MTFKLTPRLWLALVAIGPAAAIAIQALPLLRSLFLLMLIATFLALLIAPLADNMERRGVSRGLTTGVTLFGGLAVIAGLFLMMLPILFNSLTRLAATLEGLSTSLPAEITANLRLPELGALSRQLIDQIISVIQFSATQIGSLVGQFGMLAFAAFVAFAVVFALVADRTTAPALMRLLLPERYHERTVSLTLAVSRGLSRWFIAQLAICAYYSVAYSLAGLIVGIPFAIQIGVISGLLEFIPYLGGLVGMVLSIASAATVSPTAVLLILLIDGTIGMLAVYVVVPYAFSRAVDVPPALILLGLFVGSLVGGFFAALLTVPLIASALVALREMRPEFDPVRRELKKKR